MAHVTQQSRFEKHGDKWVHPKPRTNGSLRFKIPLAIDVEGNPVYYRPDKGHLVIQGPCGSGKTVAFGTLITELCYRGWQVFIGAEHELEYLGYRDWPNVRMVATSTVDQVACIRHLSLVMHERKAALAKEGTAQRALRRFQQRQFDPVFLVLDGYSTFRGEVAQWWAKVRDEQDPSTCPAFEWLDSIIRDGLAVGVHVCLGDQRTPQLVDETQAHFDQWIALGRLGGRGAYNIVAEDWRSALRADFVPGRGTARSPKNPHARIDIQSLWTPDPYRARTEADVALLDLLRPAARTHLRLKKAAPREHQSMWQSIVDNALIAVAQGGPEVDAESSALFTSSVGDREDSHE